jgi:peroxiredoxin
MKRKMLALVIGGIAAIGFSAPGALAQGSKPGAIGGAAGQPEHKEKQEGKKATKAKLGEAAPDFTLTDTDGKTVKLSDFKGKIVVLDWFNPECPVCRGHYQAGTLQKTYDKYHDQGVVFLAINSGGKGQQGAGAEKNSKARKDWKIEFPVLLDESGKVGHAYGAQTTPHCYVINKEGVLVYNGAIDDGREHGGRIGKVNFVEKALDQVIRGETVTNAENRPYGCNVKYGK